MDDYCSMLHPLSRNAVGRLENKPEIGLGQDPPSYNRCSGLYKDVGELKTEMEGKWSQANLKQNGKTARNKFALNLRTPLPDFDFAMRNRDRTAATFPQSQQRHQKFVKDEAKRSQVVQQQTKTYSSEPGTVEYCSCNFHKPQLIKETSFSIQNNDYGQTEFMSEMSQNTNSNDFEFNNYRNSRKMSCHDLTTQCNGRILKPKSYVMTSHPENFVQHSNFTSSLQDAPHSSTCNHMARLQPFNNSSSTIQEFPLDRGRFPSTRWKANVSSRHRRRPVKRKPNTCRGVQRSTTFKRSKASNHRRAVRNSVLEMDAAYQRANGPNYYIKDNIYAALFATFFCFFPLGIASLCYTYKVRKELTKNEREKAFNSSLIGRKLAHTAIMIGVTAIAYTGIFFIVRANVRFAFVEYDYYMPDYNPG
ncbi:unnamed protein product [Clavelina lepadiformis]|uniref:Uncharacterized protein n=1 Tax=Clavelina lepadiformis TaxID=159417 RepID=A0ABP0EZ81_CLALP